MAVLLGITWDFFLLCPKSRQFLGIHRKKRDICPIPQEDPVKFQDFRTIFGHYGKKVVFLPKIFGDTGGGNMKLGEHIAGKPGNKSGKLERTGRWGGAYLRHNSLTPHGDPREMFFMS
ncbi:MAG: hypothetical protein ACLTVC_02845 [Lachnospiraceae bacterium]